MWVGNWPHFAATSYRLYHTKENYSQYPLTAFMIPMLLAAVVAASFMAPKIIAPYFVKLMLIWSPYHYSGQTVGITMIYARRAGIALSRLEWCALSAFVYSTFIFFIIRLEAGPSKILKYYGIQYPTLELPSVLGTAAEWGMILSAALLLVCLVRWCFVNRKMPPPIVMLPALAQFLWFVPGSKIPCFYTFVPFFHSIQYLLIAWAVQLKEVFDEQKIAPGRRFVLQESLRWTVGNILLGAALFWALPRLFVAPWRPIGLTTAIVFAAIQIHHFFVDGVIWKLKNPKVASPLMVNIEQLAGSPPKHALPT